MRLVLEYKLLHIDSSIGIIFLSHFINKLYFGIQMYFNRNHIADSKNEKMRKRSLFEAVFGEKYIIVKVVWV